MARMPVRKGQIPREEQVVQNVEELQIGRKTTEMLKDRNVNPLQPSRSAKTRQMRPKIPEEPILLCILAILPLTWLKVKNVNEYEFNNKKEKQTLQ